MTGPRMLSYIDGISPIHTLTGAVKLIIFLLWSILSMVSFMTPILLVLAVLGIVFFGISKIRFSDIAFIMKITVLFLVLNLAAIYLFAPEQGVQIYRTRHLIWEGAGRFTLTKEQLFYEFNIFLKYLTIIPPAILLVVTTHPSEFAASLNRIGVPYTAAYSISLALRYIPDIQRDYESISQSQQARGLELSRKASWIKRLKRTVPLLLPLIFSSLDRIDVISRAMELRGFGKYRKRTWYSAKPFSRADIVSLAVSVFFFAVGIWLTFREGNRFYNPFK
ncbi:MAG: energy-coupling factor transporter transmembrane protein EcfT [Spirochaetaceae bacterium]|nr:energy-coupling factor transporter transmembrane protein EcfT [Spirochaetaceae bacterium]